jgi:hypothetical protein
MTTATMATSTMATSTLSGPVRREAAAKLRDGDTVVIEATAAYWLTPRGARRSLTVMQAEALRAAFADEYPESFKDERTPGIGRTAAEVVARQSTARGDGAMAPAQAPESTPSGLADARRVPGAPARPGTVIEYRTAAEILAMLGRAAGHAVTISLAGHLKRSGCTGVRGPNNKTLWVLDEALALAKSWKAPIPAENVDRNQVAAGVLPAGSAVAAPAEAPPLPGEPISYTPIEAPASPTAACQTIVRQERPYRVRREVALALDDPDDEAVFEVFVTPGPGGAPVLAVPKGLPVEIRSAAEARGFAALFEAAAAEMVTTGASAAHAAVPEVSRG